MSKGVKNQLKKSNAFGIKKQLFGKNDKLSRRTKI